MVTLDESNHSGGSAIDRYLAKWFYFQGHWIASRPALVITLCLVFSVICGLGSLHISFITEPQDLWVPKDAEVSIEKSYFDSKFGPFFRIEQIIITSNVPGQPDVITPSNLFWLFDLQDALANITVQDADGNPYTVNDLCYKLMDGKPCMTTTVTEYWQNQRANLTASIAQFGDPRVQIYFCSTSRFSWDSCRMSSGVPMQNATVLGNAIVYNVSPNKYLGAEAMLVTYLLLNGQTADIAMLWEQQALEVIRQYAALNPNVSLSYSLERSVNDEVNRETTSDIFTIGISYALMFFYVSLSIGKFHPVKSKFIVGLTGILIVILSVAISVGLCSLFNVHATLIISEVIPFLILAIGVDNMFILVNTIDSLPTHMSIPDTLATALSQVGSSMMLASLSEFLAFMLGSLTKMPAVQAFCLYAGVAVLANFLLQITAFVAVLSIDLKRVRARRVDVAPCVKLGPEWSGEQAHSVSSLIKWFMDKIFAPVILFLPVRIILVCAFVAISILSLFAAQNIQMGLDQSTAIPRDSYLIKYFHDETTYLAVGPPVYFVTKDDLNYTTVNTSKALNTYYESIVSTPYIYPGSSALWIADFYEWVGKPGCVNENVTFNADGSLPYADFGRLLQKFINSDCCHLQNTETPLCGFQYRYDISFSPDPNQSGLLVVNASRIRAQTSVLKTQDDYITSIKAAYATTQNSTSFSTFPYSVYFIYFAQYLFLPDVAALNVLVALAAVLITTMILLSSPTSSIYILTTIMMINVDLLAIMTLWNIYFNALSCVNMVMSIGISVEFCVHIVNAFLNARGTHAERAHKALVEMGSSVVSGIFLTKLIGVIVLNFSQSEIFQIYYFRMYLAIVFLGCLHGLIFLPCLLALFGPNEKPVSRSAPLSGYTQVAHAPSMDSLPPTSNLSSPIGYTQATQFGNNNNYQGPSIYPSQI